ncbi:MAG: ribbon-helix-helix protein, CopG family [Verrucomicrobia bacterium]|nr:ribbon-helix-helix protein, CopG family [Verrucomicrobiota bacterium]
MPTLTLKVSSEFKARLSRAARRRKVSVSELVRSSVEKAVPAAGRGFLLGRLKPISAAPSTYDPSTPAFDESEWEVSKR